MSYALCSRCWKPAAALQFRTIGWQTYAWCLPCCDEFDAGVVAGGSQPPQERNPR